jgi:hypothetical protein
MHAYIHQQDYLTAYTGLCPKLPLSVSVRKLIFKHPVALFYIQYHYYRHNATHQSYMYMLLFLLSTYFGLSRPSSGVTSHAKTAILYRMT